MKNIFLLRGHSDLYSPSSVYGYLTEYVAPLSGEILRNHCYTYLLGVPYFFLIEYCLSLS